MLGRNKTAEAMIDNPPPKPRVPMPRVSDFAPRPPVLPATDEAARVIDNIVAQQKEIAALIAERDRLHHDASILAAQLQDARAELADVRDERDQCQRAINRIEAQAETLGSLALKVIEEIRGPSKIEPRTQADTTDGPPLDEAELERSMQKLAAESRGD